MQAAMAWLLSAALLVGFAAQADAKRATKKPKHYAAHQVGPARRGGGAEEQWYPRDASKLPFGSSLWWDQMLRENRLTCCN